jgi:hypothetical protein
VQTIQLSRVSWPRCMDPPLADEVRKITKHRAENPAGRYIEIRIDAPLFNLSDRVKYITGIHLLKQLMVEASSVPLRRSESSPTLSTTTNPTFHTVPEFEQQQQFPTYATVRAHLGRPVARVQPRLAPTLVPREPWVILQSTSSLNKVGTCSGC